ncbi:MAG: hypothetical protein QOJ40_822 [Verrucomicrobiota bacterium]
MRVRNRWLLLGVLVAVAVVIVGVLGSRRTVDPGVTISFMGYTNLPNAKVRSAVFTVHYQRRESIHVSAPSVEVERLDFYAPGTILAPNRMPASQRSGGGYEWLFIVDEPLTRGRWRASWLIYHHTLGGSLLGYAAGHRLLPTRWLIPLLTHQGPGVWFNCVTNSSIWLTNSP